MLRAACKPPRRFLFFFHSELLFYVKYPMRTRAQVSLFAHIFNSITYKLKHLRFQLIRYKNYEQRPDQASILYDF